VTKPIVLVPACNRVLGKHAIHFAGQKYVDAARLAGGQPLVVPSARPEEIDALLDLADGILLTGSPSNVHPRHFDEGVHDATLPLDPARDAWTLPLIPKALARGVPLLAICRGAQEVNVALGGSLHQAVQEVPGFNDHRDDDDAPVELQYGPAHSVVVEPGGVLDRVLGRAGFQVNSLHAQAVNRLGAGLIVEARAPDGVIEAFSQPGAPGFNLCVQWHPEWQAQDNPVSMQILAAFGAACSARRQHKTTP
jgi:putative glutamine amidotransferase